MWIYNRWHKYGWKCKGSTFSNGTINFNLLMTVCVGDEKWGETKNNQEWLKNVFCVNVKDIRYAWKMFSNWLKISFYKEEKHQCLEEHIEGINNEMEYKIKLFMPIA